MTRSDCYERGRAPFFAGAALASALLGCSAQVDIGYRGEPLATIHGTVTSTRGALATDRPVVAAVLWYLQSSSLEDIEPKFIGERVAVRGSFPANFTLDIYNPPPPIAEMTTVTEYYSNGEVANQGGTPMGVWTGFVVALDPRAKDDEVKKEDILGIDTSHTLFYLEESAAFHWDLMQPLDPEMFVQFSRYNAVERYSIPLTPGFHLAKSNPESQVFWSKMQDCTWGEMCVHWIDPTQQDYFDWDFLRCTERFPQNPACTSPREALLDDLVAGGDCPPPREGAAERAQACLEDTLAWRRTRVTLPYLENPADLADPITIEMGTTLWDRPL